MCDCRNEFHAACDKSSAISAISSCINISIVNNFIILLVSCVLLFMKNNIPSYVLKSSVVMTLITCAVSGSSVALFKVKLAF